MLFSNYRYFFFYMFKCTAIIIQSSVFKVTISTCTVNYLLADLFEHFKVTNSKFKRVELLKYLYKE